LSLTEAVFQRFDDFHDKTVSLLDQIRGIALDRTMDIPRVCDDDIVQMLKVPLLLHSKLTDRIVELDKSIEEEILRLAPMNGTAEDVGV
jgi:hypothetical protein